MPLFHVVANRTTVYEVEADDSEHAIDLMMAGVAQEVDGTTHHIAGKEICPICKEELDEDGNCKDGHEVPRGVSAET